MSLTYIYGIGSTAAHNILQEAGIEDDVKVQDWTDDNIRTIANAIQNNYTVEGELRSEVQLNIQRTADEHQAADGYRLLPWVETQERSSGKRSANQDKCTYQKGT